jgi:hypothetical protein
VDHYWLLTAAHVGDNGVANIMINGEIYYQQDIVFHDQADLALVRFDKPFPGYYFLFHGEIYHNSGGMWGSKVWHELIMVGYGYDGTVSSDSFTQGSSYCILRWGTNKGKSESTVSINVGGATGGRTSSCFHVEFNLNDTDYEAGGNTLDSGGGVFATNSAGYWDLAGIIAYRSGNNPYTGNDAVKIADYISWIKSVIVDYDSDNDFLPDWWEEKHAGNATSMVAEADNDSDGVSNYKEWMADTDPTNDISFFHILEWNAPTNIIFVSSTNRQFCVECCNNLVDTNDLWVVDGSWFVGEDMQTEKIISESESNKFYRIRVKLL